MRLIAPNFKRFCIVCGYDLRASRLGRCSECGTKFDPLNPRTFAKSRSVLYRILHRMPRLRRWFIDKLTTMNCSTCGRQLQGSAPGRCAGCNAYLDPRDFNSVSRLVVGTPPLLLRLRNGEFWRGVMIPSALLIYGAYTVHTETMLLPPDIFSTEEFADPTGTTAVGMGWAVMGAGFALHCHFFWGRIEPFWRYSMIGVVAGCGFIAVGWSIALVTTILQAIR